EDATSDWRLGTRQSPLKPCIQDRFAIVHESGRTIYGPFDELEALRHVGLFKVGAQIPSRITETTEHMLAAVCIYNGADDNLRSLSPCKSASRHWLRSQQVIRLGSLVICTSRHYAS